MTLFQRVLTCKFLPAMILTPTRLFYPGFRAKTSAHLARFFSANASIRYENVLVSRPDPAVALITLNRPKALNALNAAHFSDISMALKEADENPDIGAMVLTGSDKAFAGTSHHMFSSKRIDDCLGAHE